jgi:hypothetical protein
MAELETKGEIERFVRQILARELTLLHQLRAILHEGAGSPEGVVEAPVGHLYLRQGGGIGTVLYVKESGTGNTGWVAK